MSRILVVDDSPTQAEVARMILSQEGHLVDVVTDGETALRQLATSPYDMVLTDVLMPQMSGFELCQRIRGNPSTAELPVVMVTALNHPAEIIRGLEHGADSYVIKPYEPDNLIARVRSIFANHRLRHRNLASASLEFVALGHRFSLGSDPQRTLEFLVSTLEDFVSSRETETRSQQALEEANRRYRLLFENAADAILVTDDRACVIDANRESENLTGYPRAVLLTMRLMDLDPSFTWERYEAYCRSGALSGDSSIRRRNGETVPVEYRGARTEPGRYQAIVRDITQRWQAEQARQQLKAEEALRVVVEGTAAKIGSDFFRSLVQHLAAALNLEHAVIAELQAERATVVVMGGTDGFRSEYTAEGSIVLDVMGRRVTWYSDALMRFPHDPLLADVRAAGFLAVPLQSSSGHMMGMLAIIDPQVQAEPRTIATLQVFAVRAAVEMDRMRTEAALRQSEEQYRTIIETTDQGVWKLDLEGRVVYANRRAAEQLGRTVVELLGHDWLQFMVPDDRAQYRTLSTSREQRDIRFLHQADREVWILLSTSPLFDSRGEPVGRLAMSTDITRRRQLEIQLHQSQKMEAVGQLAGGIAHDFNNLLTAITGYGEIVKSSLPAGDPSIQDMEAVLKAGENAARLVRQLLIFSRKEVPKPAVVSLNEVVVETRKLLARIIGERITLDTRLAPDLGALYADPSRVQQIVINLVVNSRDAMPDGGRIVIETSNAMLTTEQDPWKLELPEGPYVVLSVSDHGCGMTAEVRARIFEPFFTTKEAGRGTGLGLATVLGITQDAGGAVNVYSEPGLGTTVRVYLPRTNTAVSEVHSTTSAGDVATGETVLLVEDEKMVRELTYRLLTRAGYRVIPAGSGAEALELLDAHSGPVHLLLTDVVMPELNGPQVAEQIRQRYPEVRVLYMSGYSPTVVMRPGLLTNTTRLLEKPFSPQDLTNAVRHALS